jgi:hypothetical protein
MGFFRSLSTAVSSRSLRSMWIFYASVAVLGLVLSTFISRQQLSTEQVETRTGLEKAAGVGTSPADVRSQGA